MHRNLPSKRAHRLAVKPSAPHHNGTKYHVAGADRVTGYRQNGCRAISGVGGQTNVRRRSNETVFSRTCPTTVGVRHRS
jgi:hypothetical protein